MADTLNLEITHTTDIPDMQAIAATLLERAAAGASMAHLPGMLACDADGIDLHIRRTASGGFWFGIDGHHSSHGLKLSAQALHQLACLAILALGVDEARDTARRVRNTKAAA